MRWFNLENYYTFDDNIENIVKVPQNNLTVFLKTLNCNNKTEVEQNFNKNKNKKKQLLPT